MRVALRAGDGIRVVCTTCTSSPTGPTTCSRTCSCGPSSSRPSRRKEAGEAFTLVADGEHEVRYRAIDAAGVISEVRSLALKIDRTAPTVRLSGATDGADYLDSEILDLQTEARDNRTTISRSGVVASRPGVMMGLSASVNCPCGWFVPR